MRTSTVRVPGSSSTGRAATAWAPVGVGKKRRRRNSTVPDVEATDEGATSFSVTRSASPGRARVGETRTVGSRGGPGSAERAGHPSVAAAPIARILK